MVQVRGSKYGTSAAEPKPAQRWGASHASSDLLFLFGVAYRHRESYSNREIRKVKYPCGNIMPANNRDSSFYCVLSRKLFHH